MKISIVGTTYPYRGGLAAFNEQMAYALKKEGHEVNIYTFTRQYPNFLFPGKTQYSEDAAPENLNIVRSVDTINSFTWKTTAKKITSQNPDLVIFAYWTSFVAPSFGSIARQIQSKSPKTVCIGLVHNMIPHEPNILDKYLPQYFVRPIDGFLTLSQSVLSDIEKVDPENKPKTWSPHPIYDHYGSIISKTDAQKNLKLDPSFRYLLFFGLIRDYKGLDLLLDAFSDQRLRQFNIKLLIAGEFYGDANQYLKQIETLQLENQIIIHSEFIPSEEISSYFCASEMVVLPYKSATQSGITQIAFHFEKPMLVTNVGGLSEIISPEIGYVVTPEPKAIADALVDFYENKRETVFSKNTVKEKEKYSWNKLSKALIDLFEKIRATKD